MQSDQISEKTKQNLLTIAERISVIKNKLMLSSSSLTPVNYAEEMDKFMHSDTYNPHYTYRDPIYNDYEDEYSQIRQEIKKLQLPVDLNEHLEDIIRESETMYKAKISIGTSEFATNVSQLFNWGKDRLDLLLSNTPKVQFQLHNAHRLQDASKIRSRFLDVLASYNITDLPIVIDDFSAHIISITPSAIKIGNKVLRYECNVDRLIVHEIESHALQIVNVKRNANQLTDLTKYANKDLYSEGLAVYNEITTRSITPEAYQTYYNRIHAVRLLHKSFREIFETLGKDLPLHKAFITTYRVKRGMGETKEPGGFPKDAAYLLGYHEIESLISDGFSKKLLYATKSPVLTTLLNKYGLIDTKNLITPKFL